MRVLTTAGQWATSSQPPPRVFSTCLTAASSTALSGILLKGEEYMMMMIWWWWRWWYNKSLIFRVVSAYENKIVRPETRLGGWFLHNFGEPTFPKFVDVIIEGANDCDKVMMMMMMMRELMIVTREFVRAWMSTGSHSTPAAPTVTSSMTTSQKWVNLMCSATSFYCFSLKILEET